MPINLLTSGFPLQKVITFFKEISKGLFGVRYDIIFDLVRVLG